jgi:rhomboid protease GluP
MNQETPPTTTPGPAEGAPQGIPAPRSVRVPMPQSAPYVTYTIIGVTVFMFILQLLSIAIFGRYSAGLDLVEIYGALIGDAVRNGQVWRLITPILLHDNSFFLHILFNIYALYSFGNGLEQRFGHKRFLLLYLLGGFSGNVMSFIVSSQHYSYSIGASTAIFGLLAAEGVFLYQNRKLFAGQFRRAIGNILFIAAINLFVIGSLPGIDNWGHIGGLLGGLAFTWFAGPLWDVESDLVGGFHLVDRRPASEIVIGATVVLAVFGTLAVWGIVR